MTYEQLAEEIRRKKSFLCIGLDSDPSRIPAHLHHDPDPVFSFNKAIIDATHDLCVAYKPNIAFYEALGPQGWKTLEKTLDYIPNSHFTIADAKRGDIGNTAKKYAQAFFESMNFDAITVAPYMGHDSVIPFLEFSDKWVILLALTSNAGSTDFQFFSNENGQYLYQRVLERSMEWGENLMYVVGATHPDRLADIRAITPNHFLLVPGVGAQGGSLQAVIENGRSSDGTGLLINSSRGIIYAGSEIDFADKARQSAQKLQLEMAHFL